MNTSVLLRSVLTLLYKHQHQNSISNKPRVIKLVTHKHVCFHHSWGLHIDFLEPSLTLTINAAYLTQTLTLILPLTQR